MGVSSLKAKETSINAKKFILVIFFVIPMVGFSFIIGSGLSYLGVLNNYYVNEVDVNTDEFIAGDPLVLASAAENWSRINYLYCFPQNLTGDGWDYYPIASARYQRNPSSFGIKNESQLLKSVDVFDTTDPFNKINSFEGTGHSSSYCGTTLIGEALKYAVNFRENNFVELAETEEMILKLVKAYHLLSDIDPDGRMARYVIPDTPKARDSFKYFPFNTDYADSHLFVNSTYIEPNDKEYTFWLETGTSVDLYLSILTGLGITYRFVNNGTIRSIIRTTVDRMLTFFQNSGWKFVDLDGKTHSKGSEALNSKPLTDAGYCLAFLLVGKTVHPEKWEPIYESFARERLFARKVGKQSGSGVHYMFSWADGYFNINLMMQIAGCLTILETNPDLELYYRNFFDKVYSIIRKHRNAWFDTWYALGMSSLHFDDYENYIQAPTTDLEASVFGYLQEDTADCLMRCAYKKKTGRRFLNPICNQSYDEFSQLTPIKGAKYPNVQYYDWEGTIDVNNPIMKIISGLYSPEHAWTHTEGIWDRPIPADWRRTTVFMWEYSPFDTILNTGYTGYQQCPNGDLTTPYWIARYLDFKGI